MAVTPDLRQGAALADEGVVVRHAAVLVKPHHHAVVVGEGLRRMARQVAGWPHLTVADGEEQVAVLVEHHTPAVVAVAAVGVGLKHGFHLPQAVVVEAPPHHGGAGVAAHIGGETQIEQAVGGEVRVGQHLEQAALIHRMNLRHASHRRPQQPAVLHHPQASGALGDQQGAVWQPGHGPGGSQALGHLLYPEIVEGGLMSGGGLHHGGSHE